MELLLPTVTIIQPCAKASSSDTVLLCDLEKESSTFWALHVGKERRGKQDGKLFICFNKKKNKKIEHLLSTTKL